MGGGGFRFEKNARVNIDGVELRLLKKLTDKRWQLVETRTGSILEHDETDLFEQHYKGNLRFIGQVPGIRTRPVHRELSETEKADVRWRMHFIKAVQGLPASKAAFDPAIEDAWKRYKQDLKQEVAISSTRRRRRWGHTHRPGWITVYRWRTRYEQSGDNAYSLVNKDHKAVSIDPDLAEIIDNALEDEYLIRERNPLQEAIDAAIIKCKDENERRERLGTPLLSMPTRREVQSRLSLISAFDICAARYGRQVALTRFRAVHGHRVTTQALERCEIDHTPLDCFVVDDMGLPLGRPYVTMCVDDYTRCILGLYIGFVPPSYQSVANCLKHAFMAKIGQNFEYLDVKHPWIACGLVRTLVVDQAAEMHSEALETACAQLGITIEYAPRKQGWYKGKIERVLGRLNREMAHGKPGTTFSDIFEKGDYNPEEFAVIRLSTLKQGIHIWVCDVYHQKKHNSLGMPPETMWKLNVRTEDVRLPADRDCLDIVMGRPYPRVLTHKGVEFKGLYYGSDELHQLRHLYGTRLDVQIRVDESDIGQIHVLYGDEIVIARALRDDYAVGLSLWLHEQIQKHSPKYDPDIWLAGKQRIKELFQRDREHLKAVSRRGRGRVIEQQPELALPSPKATKELPRLSVTSPESESLNLELSDIPTYKVLRNYGA
jgi:putative transposase